MKTNGMKFIYFNILYCPFLILLDKIYKTVKLSDRVKCYIHSMDTYPILLYLHHDIVSICTDQQKYVHKLRLLFFFSFSFNLFDHVIG